MAVTPTSVTQTLTSPILEGSLTAFLKSLEPLMGQQIQTSAYAPQIAQQASFTQAAQQAAARQGGLGALTFDPATGAVTQVGAGTGIAGYEPYLQQAQRLTGTAESTLGGVAPYQQQLQAAGTTLGGVAPYQQQLQAAGTTLGGVAPYQQQLQAAGTTLGGATQYTGPQAYQPFMSPYQQEVIDTSLAALQREQEKGLGTLRQRAIQADAFGGGREGVAMGEYQATSDIGRAQLEAQLRQQGFSQAQQQAAQAFAQQQALAQEKARMAGQGFTQQQSLAQQLAQMAGQGFTQQQALAQEQARQAGQGFTQQQALAQQQAQLGQQQLGFAQQQPTLAAQQISQLSGLGQSDLAYRQALIDAQAVAAKEAQYEPFTRLGLVGQQLAQIQPGAFPTQTVGYQQPQAPVSPLSTALGVGTGIASIGSKLGLFG
jgi:hypothetical protein